MSFIIFYILGFLIFLFLVLSLIIIYTTRESFNSKDSNQHNNNKLIKSPMKFTQQLDFLTYSKFSPKCCPSVYSSSSGCLCFDHDEDTSIITRGNNRHFTQNDCYIKSITKRPQSSN